MLSSELIQNFEALLSARITSAKPLAGGDINHVYLLNTEQNKFVVKLNDAIRFPGMFEAEANGLESLRSSNSFTIPQVMKWGEHNKDAFLILEYVDAGVQDNNFWEQFGEKLALLHQKSEAYYGFQINNYIGSLPQYNDHCNSSVDFYRRQRLAPQFDLAIERGFSFSIDLLYKNIEDIIPEEPSSLIHGDLWGGNYIVDSNGMPCLIDPAVAYAPREMDIAMMQLFGGFDARVFDAYNEVFSLEKGWKDRVKLFQLYYLLVHLNLFGSSYFRSVQDIINLYS